MIKGLNMKLWEREFEVIIDYDCDEDENPTTEQVAALDWFVEHFSLIDECKTMVEQYCSAKVLEDEANTKKDNIFSYLKPDYVFVKQEKDKPRVAVMFKYRYDQEHGLAVVLMPDDSVVIGPQDIIL